MIGISPAPIALTPRCSAAESPTKAASPETMIASEPAAVSTVLRSQASALLFAMRASAFAVSATLLRFRR